MREYAGCLLTLAAVCVLAGAPLAVVAGIVFWKLLGGLLLLAGAALVVVVLVGGSAVLAELAERFRRTPR